jgi:hypothetical protein
MQISNTRKEYTQREEIQSVAQVEVHTHTHTHTHIHTKVTHTHNSTYELVAVLAFSLPAATANTTWPSVTASFTASSRASETPPPRDMLATERPRRFCESSVTNCTPLITPKLDPEPLQPSTLPREAQEEQEKKRSRGRSRREGDGRMVSKRQQTRRTSKQEEEEEEEEEKQQVNHKQEREKTTPKAYLTAIRVQFLETP